MYRVYTNDAIDEESFPHFTIILGIVGAIFLIQNNK